MGVVEVGNRHAHRRGSGTCHPKRRNVSLRSAQRI